MSSNCTDLSQEVHDWWFNADQVKAVIKSSGERLVLPLSRQNGSPPEKEIVFDNVSSIRIVDNQRIGWYDINRFYVDNPQQKAVIVGNIPIRIEIGSLYRLGITVSCL